MSDREVIVVGAGPAGLATAATLRGRGVDALVLERSGAVGASWRRHYERLRLHTNSRLSHLPGLRFPPDAGRYPSRQSVVDYLERYRSRFEIPVRFHSEVTRATRAGRGWRVRFGDGERSHARHLVVATGLTGDPVVPAWPGASSFPGPISHSSAYRDGSPYRGQDVLVVGFGNSAGEIALDLAEHGAQPTLSVRGPVNILPREIFGVPVLAVAIPLSLLPAAVADALSAPLLRLLVGSYERLGLEKKRKGPFRQIAEEGRIPLIDVGTVDLLREGGAGVRGQVASFDGAEVRFLDGPPRRFDAVIAATGYRPSFDRFLDAAVTAGVTGEHGLPLRSGAPSGVPGLWFCGFHLSPTGMLREIGIEARRIARYLTGGSGGP